jgi:hypothetical protein
MQSYGRVVEFGPRASAKVGERERTGGKPQNSNQNKMPSARASATFDIILTLRLPQDRRFHAGLSAKPQHVLRPLFFCMP